MRVFGAAVERVGGIADGMSGSPVYLDGRLAGAISHVYEGTDRSIGLVTPIAPMLKLLSLAAAREREAPAGASPVRSPLLVSGMSGRSLEMATAALKGQRTVVVASSAGARSSPQSQAVAPGSAVAVQLVDGDIGISAIGTVTYVESGAFVAFGHHFEAAGTVDYMASAAEIVLIVQSDSGPYKIAAPLTRVGHVTQDRFTGLAGMLGADAATVEVAVDVRDTETGEERTYEFTVVRDERFVHSLIMAECLKRSTAPWEGLGTALPLCRCRCSCRAATVTRSNTAATVTTRLWSLSEISEAVD